MLNPTSIRREVASELSDAARTFDALFGALGARGLDGRHGLRHAVAERYPHLAVSRGEEGFTLVGDLPGVRPEELELSVEGRTLILRGTRAQGAEEGWELRRQERPAWRFERRLTLSEEVDAEAIQARLRDGVLTLELPLRAPTRRTIEVRD